ncbi:T9SS type B sorting domain-containing protein [Mangrovimonas futianensis]|uniref:T9SS type B sorting domain-containing protein n=1 Tax=Mangrovimonas futianensis TaxID=2895523 RepID=UPI001E46DEA5|nr:T9SS type B sorting domain-containing protein [Mangrovimonas futianensis]MCF1420378.1 T9SS type B sorting domain-containing protein [Mangrovimonas futianensis]
MKIPRQIKIIYPQKKYFFLWVLFFIAQIGHSQLSDFNFSVSSTDETCSGNGSIQMTVSGTTAGSTILYTLYEYPDVGTPIAQTSNNAFNNLESGDYLVIATQTLNNEQGTQQADATIANATTALDYEITQFYSNNCTTTNLEIIVLSGNPVTYEIISGPITVPTQSSNIFNNLPVGTYVVRVNDDCGNALTKTFTVVLGTNSLNIDEVSLPAIFASCDEIDIFNQIYPDEGSQISYPLQITYTVYPPDGSPSVTYNQTISNGDGLGALATQTIGIFEHEEFEIDIVVEDGCGNLANLNDTILPEPLIVIAPFRSECGRSFSVITSQITPPYTMEITDYPDGFDPSEYNSMHPGPFTENGVHPDDMDADLPYGSYTVEVEDSCGRTASLTFTLEEILIDPIVVPMDSGCGVSSGSILIKIPTREMVSASIIVAPDAFDETLPFDVSEFISSDGSSLTVENLPMGDYIILVIDECGDEYEIEFTIPEASVVEPIIYTTPNCETETGTLRIFSPVADIASILILQAPPEFSEALPYDFSAQINTIGIFYTNQLAAGDYVVQITDECGNIDDLNIFVPTYYTTPNIYNLNVNCGSFDVGVFETNNSIHSITYWFQKYFPETDTWGHPDTGVPYTEGDMPNTDNAIQMQNEEMIYNIFLTGTFRLVKAFKVYNNPNPNAFCLDIFAEFEISQDLIIQDVFNLNCDGSSGNSDILVDVIGIAPYNFSIVSPFLIDNGEDNIFTDLPPGTYEIKVEDACGSIENTIVNLEDLVPVVSVFTPDDIVICNENGSTTGQFDLTQQTSQVLGNQNPENYTVTYHLSQSDADTGNNPISTTFTNTTSPQTIYVRVVHNTLEICHGTTSFQIIVGYPPSLSDSENIMVCDGSSIVLQADQGYDAYLWSTGQSTPSIVVTDSGEYTVTVSNNFGDFYCDSTKTFTVFSSSIATIESVETNDWTANNNTIEITVSGFGDYEYSIDGFNFQDSNFFGNLLPGEYTVYVRDKNGCGLVTEVVYLMNYPSFFTPNDDGQNDFWQIYGAETEPGLEVIIFDRYGKLLTTFKGSDWGWDGTYNGHNMPSNDYWFLVTRISGETYRGHFSLKR